jgi:hypothetical protein
MPAEDDASRSSTATLGRKCRRRQPRRVCLVGAAAATRPAGGSDGLARKTVVTGGWLAASATSMRTVIVPVICLLVACDPRPGSADSARGESSSGGLECPPPLECPAPEPCGPVLTCALDSELVCRCDAVPLNGVQVDPETCGCLLVPSDGGTGDTGDYECRCDGVDAPMAACVPG